MRGNGGPIQNPERLRANGFDGTCPVIDSTHSSSPRESVHSCHLNYVGFELRSHRFYDLSEKEKNKQEFNDSMKPATPKESPSQEYVAYHGVPQGW